VCDKLSVPTAEQQTLLENFDKLTAALLAAGITRGDLIARLEKGE
jgi:hypothetical protein